MRLTGFKVFIESPTYIAAVCVRRGGSWKKMPITKSGSASPSMVFGTNTRRGTQELHIKLNFF